MKAARLFSITKTDNTVILNIFRCKISISKSKFWEFGSGPYNYYDILKEYAGLRFWFKGIKVQHGWTPADIADINDVQTAKLLMLCMSARDKRNFEALSKVRCEIAGSPFVHYRRRHSIKQPLDARGTVAFPSHSIQDLKAVFDIEKYCETLNALPAEFHPITICLHPADISSFGLDKFYKDYGFTTACAGQASGGQFHINFYEILRKHKYSTSNDPGSYSFYSVELGIPFFLLGEEAIRDNSSGANVDVPAGPFKISDLKYGKIARDLFSTGPVTTISEQQISFVESELGINDCLSPEAMHKAFWDVAVIAFTSKGLGRFFANVLITTSSNPTQITNTFAFLIEMLRHVFRKRQS